MPATELTDVHVAIMQAHRAGNAGEARRLYSRTLPLLLFQQTFRVRMTKAVLAARGLLGSTFARAAGPKLDAGDDQELAALVDEAHDIFHLHPPISRSSRDAA